MQATSNDYSVYLEKHPYLKKEFGEGREIPAAVEIFKEIGEIQYALDNNRSYGGRKIKESKNRLKNLFSKIDRIEAALKATEIEWLKTFDIVQEESWEKV